MTRRRAPKTPDLFSVPQPTAPLPASHDFRRQVAELTAGALKGAEGDRYSVAADMSRLTGRDVTKYMLDAYSSGARDTFNLPFWEVPALEAVCGTHALSAWLADVRGGQLLVGREALNAELGRLEQMREGAARRIRDLKRMMGEQE